MAEKRSPRKSLRSTIAEARPRASPVGTLSGRNPEAVAAVEKMSKHHHARDTGGRSVLLSRHCEPGSVSGSTHMGNVG